MSVSFANGHQDSSVMTPPGSPPDADPMAASTPDSQSSVEDYDEITQPVTSLVARRRPAKASTAGARQKPERANTGQVPTPIHTGDDTRAVIIRADDVEIRDVLRRGLQRAQDPTGKSGGRAKFSDLVFTRKFSAFDRQNEDAANSPFHGFFTLFWMAMFFFMVKIGAENWRKWGNPLGANEIIQAMVRRDLIYLLLADGVMCGLTGVSWLLQRVIHAGYISWDRSGLVVQNVSLLVCSVQ